jgi:hypothetical protein
MIINPAEILSNVTDQKKFFLKENGLEKGCYIIFVQIILACKNARKPPKSYMNFVTPTKFLKSQISGIWRLKKKPIWQHRSSLGLPRHGYLSQAWHRGWLPKVTGAHRSYITRSNAHCCWVADLPSISDP